MMEKVREALARDISNYDYNERHDCYDFKEELYAELKSAEEALEKQTAKKVINEEYCPSCGEYLEFSYRYCPECGQKLEV